MFHTKVYVCVCAELLWLSLPPAVALTHYPDCWTGATAHGSITSTAFDWRLQQAQALVGCCYYHSSCYYHSMPGIQLLPITEHATILLM
jgi:hypothetical protein